MSSLASTLYWTAWLVGRATFFCTMNTRVHRREIPRRHRGPFVLAVTHLGNVEPFIVGDIVRRRIDWMARKEFFRFAPFRWFLTAIEAFSVDRQGVPVKAIRTSLQRLAAGRVVGVFPEGGVSQGEASVCVGGPIKLGACLVACRAKVPIVPCVVLGTPALQKVGPWLPARRGYLWVAFGDPIPPVPVGGSSRERKAAYAESGRRLATSMRALHDELCAAYGLDHPTGATYAEPATASDSAWPTPSEPRPSGSDGGRTASLARTTLSDSVAP